MKRQKYITQKISPPGHICYWEILEGSYNRPKRNVVAGPEQEWHSAVDVSCTESKVWCYKEQYCIGIWKIRSMNQSKLVVVKQEMVRLTINILGISELKWMGMGKFNSDVYYSYYCGQETLRRNGVALIVNKRIQNAVTWVQSQIWQNDLIHFQGKPFNVTVIQVYAPTTNAEETEVEQFYEDLQDLPELTPKKDALFIIRH